MGRRRRGSLGLGWAALASVFLGICMLPWGSGQPVLQLSAQLLVGGGNFEVTVTRAALNLDPAVAEGARVFISADKLNEPTHEVTPLLQTTSSGVETRRLAPLEPRHAANNL